MTDQQTTVLYVLTTLAQSCAALAAFVGAVGVFRIQMLREQRQGEEREFRTRTQILTAKDMIQVPISVVIKTLEEEDFGPYIGKSVEAAKEARDQWKRFVPRIKQARTTLIVLELWNLVIIGVALIGFNYVPALTRASWFSYALLVVALGTVLVPIWCVIVWTRGAEE